MRVSRRYLLRSQREWADRGRFDRIYPRPSQRDAPGGDQLERLLGYIGQLYPDYARAKYAAVTSSAVAGGGVSFHETSWMVRVPHRLHAIYMVVLSMIIAKCRLDSNTIRCTSCWHELKAKERMATSLQVTNSIGSSCV